MLADSLKRGGLALALLGLAPLTAAHASGSMGGGASSGMKLGQSVYMRKIVCKKCKFAGGLKGQEQVSSAQAMIEGGQIALSGPERVAVQDYIAKRFKAN
jgi:hypothetical protein